MIPCRIAIERHHAASRITAERAEREAHCPAAEQAALGASVGQQIAAARALRLGGTEGRLPQFPPASMVTTHLN